MSGEHTRAGSLFKVLGEKTTKIGEAQPGDIVAVAKVDAVGPSGYVTDLSLLENRYQFARYLKERRS